MKLKIGIPDYAYRCMGEIGGAKILGRKIGRDIALILVTQETMDTFKEKWKNVRGIPVYVSFDVKRQKLWFHPNPDGEYEVDVFLPPGKVKSEHTLTLPKKAAA